MAVFGTFAGFPSIDGTDPNFWRESMVTGEKTKEGINAQATVVAGKTRWGTTLEGSSDIRIVEEDGTVSRDILSGRTLATYFERHGGLATSAMLDRTLAPGDLLDDPSDIPAEAIPSHESLSISQSSHVTIWTGQTLPIPGRSDVGVPRIMDSHGGTIQVGVDAANRPIGVVEPSGPPLRPFFAPTPATTSDAYVHLRSFLPADAYADQNDHYLTSFSHAVRISFPVPS